MIHASGTNKTLNVRRISGIQCLPGGVRLPAWPPWPVSLQSTSVGFSTPVAGLTPSALTLSRFAERFEQVYGRHDGFRRNHAKGLSATGTFASNGAGVAVSKASVFTTGTVPVIGRFSLSGGLPDQVDKPDTVRGLALEFLLPNGEQWRTAMVNIPVFPDSTPEGFYERLLASKALPDSGRPDPQKMAAFLPATRDRQCDEDHQAVPAEPGV